MRNPYAVGTLWHTSWGYDQTNVEHFQVVKETTASVVLRRIRSELREGRLFPVRDGFCTDFHLMGNATEYDPQTETWIPARRYVRDKQRGYSEKICRKRGNEHPGLNVDDVRWAWPTSESQGSYDTIAAGQAGH